MTLQITDIDLQTIIEKMQRDKGYDFSGFKYKTLKRRIERRMTFDKADSVEDYINIINKDRHLYWRLVSDFFIGVTDFFRDKEIWDIIQTEILPDILERRMKESIKLPIRIWSAGCSTGEESYSLAMAVKEAYEKKNIKRLPAFIHGTDIMEEKLEIAKQGIYSEEKIKQIDLKLRKKYFINTNSCYTVSNSVRYMMRFKKLDLVHPKDFKGFDMIVCRNVLIYFQRKLQEKVIKHFHKALRPDGILWLGKSESLWSNNEALFKPVYKNEKIFQKA